MFDMVNTPFSHGRGLIVCSLLQEFSKTKESNLRVKLNIDTAFLLCGAELVTIPRQIYSATTANVCLKYG